MSQQDSYLEVGKIGKTHGLKGEIRVSFEAFFMSYLGEVKMIFLEINGSRVPFFSEYVQYNNPRHVLIKLEGIDHREAAMDIHQKTIYVKPAEYDGLVEELDAEQIFNRIVGYTATLEDGTEVGKIEEIFYLPHQSLAQCFYEGNEVLLPLHNDLLGEINQEKETIQLLLDADFLEVYMTDVPNDDDPKED